ncbi:MAG: hypothetical protein EA394_04300 [Bacteroidia bacterium]|nr:MAG: hypothetical protein EA394_04300 [Bacteroidia bacterium]
MNTHPANIAGYTSTTNIRAILFDVFALAFIYFVPTLSHLLSIKLYMLEPMRIMVILAMVHTRRENAYILAFTLPLFSFLISAHPVLVKSILIGIELAAMAFVFFRLVRIVNPLIAIFSGIWISKMLYYGLKYLAVITVLPEEPLVGTPLLLQLITSVVFSIYVYIVLKKMGIGGGSVSGSPHRG